MAETRGVGVIRKAYRWETSALTERREWRVELAGGRRRILPTRKACIEWCEEMGLDYTFGPAWNQYEDAK